MEEKKPKGGRKRKTFFEVAEKRRKLSEERNLTRVVLGETFQRWRAMKEQRGVKTDAQFAKILLDRIYEGNLNRMTAVSHWESICTVQYVLLYIPVGLNYIVNIRDLLLLESKYGLATATRCCEHVRPRTGALTGPQRSPEVSAEIESTRSSIVKDSSTRQPVAQFLNKPSIPA
ncbi:hypothetical protein DPX16_13378 [Anabarilius grahami]|uniref:Uncharacterized protein n=1 Tax=Anabarilius grahami TaxID=495550 RepID=A0A3N0YN90_ANAGA|nr:hypothetical protein DPX16_13378 [Anabarilius grahami]